MTSLEIRTARIVITAQIFLKQIAQVRENVSRMRAVCIFIALSLRARVSVDADISRLMGAPKRMTRNGPGGCI